MTISTCTNWLLALALQLGPAQGQARLASNAICTAVEHSKQDVYNPDYLAALLLITAFGETRFDPSLRGDSGHSCGMFQLKSQNPSTCEAFAGNTYLAAAAAIHWLVDSARVCPACPACAYAGGCNNRGAQAIGLARQVLASQLVWGF